MRRRSIAAALALGGLAGLTLPRWAALRSLAIRSLSRRVPNAATRNGLRVDLGPARGRWTRGPLAADLGPVLSEVIGAPVEAAAYSRFGDFAPGRGYSAYLDPDSPYYQAWLGAYVVLDGPARQRFAFDEHGAVDTAAVLDLLDADQRLVFRSLGCPNRFADGRTVRAASPLVAEPLTVDGVAWWRVTGEAETWSTYYGGGNPKIDRRARWLYGVAPRRPDRPDAFPAIRCAGEFWLRHDPDLKATCGAFLVAPYDRSNGAAPSEPLFLAARSLLRQVRFARSHPSPDR